MAATVPPLADVADVPAVDSAMAEAPGVEAPSVEAPGVEAPSVEAPGDDELSGRLRSAVTRLNRRLRQQSLAGLSPAQASALGTINRLGTPTLGELAVAEQVQPPTVTRLVASMEQAGWVCRMTDATDGRVSRVKVTAEGRRTIQRIRTLKNAFLNRRLSELEPAERAAAHALVELLEHLLAES